MSAHQGKALNPKKLVDGLPGTEEPVIVIAGPTASGKSGMALALADAFGGTVINADSMQVYKDLRVLTARPTLDDEARVPHLLYGVLSAEERCSVGRWLAMAADAIQATRHAGRLPIIVGGTGLYLRALLEGLTELPGVAEEIRTEAQARRRQVGVEAFHAEVAAIDPKAAARIEPADGQRLTRVWEVFKATGKPLTEWQAMPPSPPVVRGPKMVLGLVPDRDALYDAINRRFDVMVRKGALEEVRALAAKNLDSDLPAMKAVGVRELSKFLSQTWPLERAIEAGSRASRQYAKRQLTWLRHQICLSKGYSAQYSESLNAEIFPFIRQFLLTPRR